MPGSRGSGPALEVSCGASTPADWCWSRLGGGARVDPQRGAGVPLADVRELRLASLALTGAPLRRALARLAGRWVAVGGWNALGFARLRDHATERLGLSPRQVYELARLDAALGALPEVEAAHLSGRIPWTKARLLVRAAVPGDEGRWIALAERLSSDALAREVRAVDGRAVERGGAGRLREREASAANAEGAAAPGAMGNAPEGDRWPEPEPRETVRLRCSQTTRAKLWNVRQVARRMAGEALPPWASMEAMAAETLSAVRLEVHPELPPAGGALEDPANGGQREAAHPRGAGLEGRHDAAGGPSRGMSMPADALRGAADSDAPEERSEGTASREAAAAKGSPAAIPSFVAGLTVDLEHLDARALEARLHRAACWEQRLLARMGPLLAEVAAERRYRDLGYRSLDAYARERLGMTPDQAHALLRLERAGRAAPALARAWRRGRVGWSRAQALVPLAALEHARPHLAAWLARAEGVTVQRLEEDVENAVAHDDPDPAHLPELPISPAPRGIADAPAGLGIRARATALDRGATEAGPAGSGFPVGLGIRAQDTASDEDARPASLRRLEPMRYFFTAPRSVARLFRATLATVQRRLERAHGRPSCEDEALEAMCDHALATLPRRTGTG